MGSQRIDQTPRVSVIVPTFNRRASVERLLEALARQTLLPEAFEAIIAVDGSQDGTRELGERFSPPFRLQVLWQPNRGRAVACNMAISAANGEVLVILDDDMEPEPGCLVAHESAHRDGQRRCVMGAVPVEEGGSSLQSYVARKFAAHHRRLLNPTHRFTLRDFYSGNVSIPRALLLEVGLFDEDFAMYGNEDLELAVRLLASGVAVDFDEKAAATQHWAKTFGQLARDTVAKGRTAVLLAMKHPEALPELQISRYGNVGPVARRLRGLLLAASRLPAFSRTVVYFTALLESLRFPRMTLYYRFVLDYFYWVGVRTALLEGGLPARLDTAANTLSAGEASRLPLHG
jgi:GT2 family glycosyltransferase